MSEKINHLIVLDFETGGLSPKKNPITQIAMKGVRGDTFEDINEYSAFVKPYDNLDLEEAALKATGIDYVKIMSGVELKQMMKEFVDKIDQVKQISSRTHKPILIGHNIGFDMGFLSYACDKTKTDLSKFLDGKDDYKGNFNPTYIDTLYLSRLMWANDPTITKFNLTSCCRKAELEEFDAHNALNDINATKDLFYFLINKMRSGTNDNKQKEVKFRDFFQF